ncbi:hypothetical protein HYE26_02010 [Mycoplasmopsis bovis]|nr:hypothetical protein [Mycoplasmopsis bovis]QQH23249.1 hypothetical protein HYE26_02010 [Mycoplasmopsis bovis]
MDSKKTQKMIILWIINKTRCFDSQHSLPAFLSLKEKNQLRQNYLI